jgi:hypothetical protein
MRSLVGHELPGFYVHVKHNYFEFKQAFEGLVSQTKYLPTVSSFSSQGASDTGHLLISKLSDLSEPISHFRHSHSLFPTG